jgi:predicted nucleotide-binding protein (sugar kinase/HSP70/actin superfamily)
MLNLVLDGQNGTAGVETRLESFLDIIRFQKGLL